MTVELVPRPAFDTSQFHLQALLDGHDGKNRAQHGRPQIAAEDDVAAISAWLAGFAESPRTLANYRKEAERLWLWATRELRKPVSSLTHEDMMRYRAFLGAPLPHWVNAKKRPRGHPDWRPLAGPLSAASIRQAEIIINSLFSWLVAAGYLHGNPLSLSRRRKPKHNSRVTRYLTQEQWRLVISSVETMPRETPVDHLKYARTRWAIRLAYLTGMRISEMCENTMGGFELRVGGDNKRRWFLTVTGKGDKLRTIPTSRELIDELVAYREAEGLPKYPRPGESTPLILALRGNEAGLKRAAMHVLFKSIFRHAQTQASPEDVERLGQASAHWLRHTRGSHLAASGVKPNSIRVLLGHASLESTSIYLHSEDEALHDEVAGGMV